VNCESLRFFFVKLFFSMAQIHTSLNLGMVWLTHNSPFMLRWGKTLRQHYFIINYILSFYIIHLYSSYLYYHHIAFICNQIF